MAFYSWLARLARGNHLNGYNNTQHQLQRLIVTVTVKTLDLVSVIDGEREWEPIAPCPLAVALFAGCSGSPKRVLQNEFRKA